MSTELMSEKMKRFGIYLEGGPGKGVLDKWCYKYQPYEIDIVIVTDIDKEKAAAKMFLELLTAIHYELKKLKEDGRCLLIQKRIENYKSWNDENVDKTIEIATRQFKL